MGNELMALLDRFRPRRNPWEHPDADARAEAVRHIPAQEQDLLGRIAREDADARVRRAAVRKLRGPAALVAAAGDAAPGVREEAAEALLALALGEDPSVAEAALAGLVETRPLVSIARTAALASTRLAAAERIGDARTLAVLARTAEDPAVRRSALARVDDAGLVLEVALKSEHKDVAVAAVDRIEGRPALETVAERAKHKAASRRARAILETGESGTTPAAEENEPAESPAAVDASEAAPPADSAVPAVPDGESAQPAEAVAAESAPAPAVEGLGATPETAPAGLAPDGPGVAEVTAPAAAEIVVPPAPEGPAVPAPDAAAERRKAEEERLRKVARFEKLCDRLEALTKAEKATRRDAEVGLRDARAAQAAQAGVPGRVRQRLREARAGLFARAQELREADEWSRWGNATVQEELCRRMEALAPVADLERVAREMHQCDARWAEVRYAPKGEAETLRDRYQAARSAVKARVDEYLAEKAKKEAENLEAKRGLCERAEALADSTDWLKTAEELKALQAQWKAVGPVPRPVSEAVWKRFRGACDRFFTRREEDLKHKKEEWSANLVKKEALCVRAEALAESTDWEAAAAEVRRLQTEWKAIGPVARKKSEAVWQRFRKACDAFFERYKRKDALALEAKRAEREAVCRELEELIPAEGSPVPEDLAAKVVALQGRLRQGVSLPHDEEEALARRFVEARNRLVAGHPESFRGTELDPETSRTRKEKLCARVEALVASAEAGGEGDLSGESLARRLKEALAANTMGAGADVEARKRAEAEEVKSAQAAWNRLGPVPGAAGTALEERFRSACTRFFEIRRIGRGAVVRT
ncbi:MAG: DUF349 domain-containing protein [Acidobacteria bacterium]|nr:DUF349 domain-containing protein [Acidobacteriota bacterium]